MLFRRPLPASWAPRRLLVVKPCCLGDALMATPSIAALGARYAGAAIDVAVDAWTRPVFLGSRRVGGTIDTGRLLGGRRPAPRELLRVAGAIRRRRYDAALVLERSFWMALLPLLAGVPVRAGLDAGGRGFSHTVAVALPKPVRHEAELYLECAARLDAPRLDPPRMTFAPDDAARAEAAARLGAAGWRGEPFALLHPGGGSNPGMQLLTKRWPPERFAEIARRVDAAGRRPILVWSPADEQPARAVLGAAPPSLLALGAGLSFAALAAAAERAMLYLGNDSGPTHLAVAVGTPTVAVFGPSDERRYGPFGRYPDGTPIGEAVASPLLSPEAPAGRWLDRTVEAVTVDRVWPAVERALAKQAVRV
ncbi:MAG TPA: glycosyltransferase family 9 protein [Chloroflexota bacterium]|nr:glycosyltransferase family 9 protein [Chloroflexota bacterium]